MFIIIIVILVLLQHGTTQTTHPNFDVPLNSIFSDPQCKRENLLFSKSMFSIYGIKTEDSSKIEEYEKIPFCLEVNNKKSFEFISIPCKDYVVMKYYNESEKCQGNFIQETISIDNECRQIKNSNFYQKLETYCPDTNYDFNKENYFVEFWAWDKQKNNCNNGTNPLFKIFSKREKCLVISDGFGEYNSFINAKITCDENDAEVEIFNDEKWKCENSTNDISHYSRLKCNNSSKSDNFLKYEFMLKNCGITEKDSSLEKERVVIIIGIVIFLSLFPIFIVLILVILYFGSKLQKLDPQRKRTKNKADDMKLLKEGLLVNEDENDQEELLPGEEAAKNFSLGFEDEDDEDEEKKK